MDPLVALASHDALAGLESIEVPFGKVVLFLEARLAVFGDRDATAELLFVLSVRVLRERRADSRSSELDALRVGTAEYDRGRHSRQ